MALKIQLRRGTAAEWTTANPVLMQGEMGVETDTLKVKLGDGSTAWSSLPYFTQGAKGDTGATGAQGPAGPQGLQGIPGVGVPDGGTEGQIIVRTVDGTVWADNYARNVEQAVSNTTGSTLAKGTAVYISGANGDNALVAKAKADSEATSSKTLGLLAGDIANGASGYVITEGTLSGVDTSAATAGAPVWLSPTVAGGLVFGAASQPTAPNHMVYLGVVLRAHAVNGVIYVKIQNGYELGELHDVAITSPADKQVLQYEAATALWKNKTASGGVRVSESEPGDTISGDGWFYSTDGTLFVRYADGDSTQWVQPNAVLSSQVEQRYYSPNYIINGAFDIWQRGNSITVPASTWTWTADRWKVVQSGGSTTCSRESSIVPSFAQYSYKMTQATSAAQVFAIQTIETSNAIQLAGKTVVLSGYFAASSSTAVTVDIAYSTNVDNGTEASWTGYLTPVSGGSGTVNSTASFTRVSGVYSIPANAKSLQVRVWTSSLTVGTSLYFCGIQLEEGVTATPFRRNANSIQGELAACQRYYCQSPSIDGAWYAGISFVDVEDSSFGGTEWPVRMRVTPTVVLYANASSPNTVRSYGMFPVRNVTGYIADESGLHFIYHDGGYNVGRSHAGKYTANAEL